MSLLDIDFSRDSGFALPSMANGSTTSLMDAVVGGGHSTGNATSRSHQVFSDASRRVNEKHDTTENAQDVQELERKLEKRRSLIPHLESELAALEAQIKAAEERLSRATQASTDGAAAQQ